MKKREAFYDLLRIISVYAVIIIHVSAENWYILEINNNWLINNFVNAMVKVWAVPLFITISGALILGNKKADLKLMFKKYIPRILLCLIFWHFIYYFYTNPIFTIENVFICVKNLIKGETYSHLWYLYMIIGIYILTPILKKLADNLSKKEFVYLLFLGFFITTLVPTLDNFSKYNLSSLIMPYEVLNFNVYIFYYLLGYYLNKYEIKKYKLITVSSIIILIGLCISETIMSINANKPIAFASTTNAAGVLVVISIFSILKKILKNSENKYISFFGKLTFGVYLVHFIVEKELIKLGIDSNMMNPVLGNILVSIIVLIISYIISYILSKIPFIKKMVM